MANALAASSEGEARPANFREGLFGPSTEPGANLLSAFGMGNADVASRWAPRYMAWMALGGTLKRIPQDIIHQVEATKVFGKQRPNLHLLLGAEAASANMLKLAAGLCAIMLPDKNSGHYYDYAAFENGNEPQFYPPYNANDTPFLDTIADRDMWLHLCTQYSPVVVRVYGVVGFDAPAGRRISREGRVGHRGALLRRQLPGRRADPRPQQGGSDRNSAGPEQAEREPLPGVLLSTLRSPGGGVGRGDRDQDQASHARLSRSRSSTSTKPPSEQASKAMWTQKVETEAMNDNIARWSLRGGIATGMSVFSYLRERRRPGTAQAVLQPVPASEVT